jgi:N-acetylglutamate synthase-like GNAT family acetyltransferase
MAIRCADTKDAGVIVDVLRQSFGTVAKRFGLTLENYPKHIAFHTEARLQEDLSRGMRFYVMEEDSHIYGCVALEPARPGVCYLGRLAVLPPHRSRGLGRTLVRHALAEAGKSGVARVEIATIAADTRLKDWYRQFGFEQTGTKEFPHLPFVVAFMAKELSLNASSLVDGEKS